jgi:two-component system cell cycle sensor histidine kinase/response regulator CckA
VRQGDRLLVAENGVEALAMLESHGAMLHLLLTDVVMPEMNGKELFRRAREIQEDLRVLYMSGYTDDVVAWHGVLGEGVDFIQKPFSVNALAAKVRDSMAKAES